MPITTQQEYGFSHRPSYSSSTSSYASVSISDAIEKVVRGELNAITVYSAMPQDMQNKLNKLVSATMGKQFKEISAVEQKDVFVMIAVAQGNSNAQSHIETPAINTGTSHISDTSESLMSSVQPPQTAAEKKWWQFWR